MRKAAIIPSLFTLGNAVCGFAAIVQLAKAVHVSEGGVIASSPNLTNAAWLILLAMIFDMFDGRVARLVRVTSDFGGQLDSLADAVSFGLAPGIMVALMNATWATRPFWAKCAWVFGAAYACCTLLRLARFNVENKHDEASHLTFKGLPSPAAAGCVATLVLLQGYLMTGEGAGYVGAVGPDSLPYHAGRLTYLLPPAALLLGSLMTSSRIFYPHVPNRYLRGRKTFDYLAYFLFAVILFALLPEVTLAALFWGFAIVGPIAFLRDLLRGAPKPAETSPPAPPPAAGGPTWTRLTSEN